MVKIAVGQEATLNCGNESRVSMGGIGYEHVADKEGDEPGNDMADVSNTCPVCGEAMVGAKGGCVGVEGFGGILWVCLLCGVQVWLVSGAVQKST